MEAMERWLSSQQGDLSAPGLHLLEAALASWRYCPAGVLPEGLREDLQQALGEEEVQAAVSNLLACHILEEVPGQESSGLACGRKRELRYPPTFVGRGKKFCGERHRGW